MISSELPSIGVIKTVGGTWTGFQLTATRKEQKEVLEAFDGATARLYKEEGKRGVWRLVLES